MGEVPMTTEYETTSTCSPFQLLNDGESGPIVPMDPARPDGVGWRLVGCISMHRVGPPYKGVIWYWERDIACRKADVP
jgi:hypothetical protein